MIIATTHALISHGKRLLLIFFSQGFLWLEHVNINTPHLEFLWRNPVSCRAAIQEPSLSGDGGGRYGVGALFS